MDCRDRRPDKYNASCPKNYQLVILRKQQTPTDLPVGKSMQVTTHLNVLVFDNDVAIASA